MEVEKLQTNAIPLSTENILWFEFLLDPSLLQRHLNNPKPDPTPFDLINKFLGFDQKNEPGVDNDKCEKETLCSSFKAVALKILAMKVVAHLKWDMDELELKLPSKVILQLLSDLLTITTESEVRLDPYPTVIYNSSLDHQTIFATILYHRWILKALMHNSYTWKHQRTLVLPQSGQDANSLLNKKKEEFRVMLESQAMDSVAILCEIAQDVKSIIVPTFESFVQPTESSLEVKPKWETGAVVLSDELKCQIHFEIGKFLMFRKEHDAARTHFQLCLPHFEAMEKEHNISTVKFCKFSKEELINLSIACDVPNISPNVQKKLIDRFKESKWDHYRGMIQVLQMDNLLREISLAERDLVEIEIQQAMSCGALTVAKDLLMKLQLLNALRRVMVREAPSVDVQQIIRNGGNKAMDFFLTSIHSVMFDVPIAEQENLHNFLFDLLLRDPSTDIFSLRSAILADEAIRKRFTSEQLTLLEKEKEIKYSVCLVQDLSNQLISRNHRLEINNIQHQLVETYDAVIIKSLLLKLKSKDPNKAWFRFNTMWDVPIPLQSAIMQLPKGMSQDLVFILVAKSRELNSRKDFAKSNALLNVALKDIQEISGINSSSLFKLSRLLGWEALLVEINEYIEKYSSPTKDLGPLTTACKDCLSASSAGESVIPRLEILESCAIALLNLGKWEALINMEKRLVFLELAAAFATACQDITKFKGAKKISRDAWDLILPVFGPVAQKRSSSGATVSPTASGLTKNSLVRFVLQLREPTVLAAATSLLARLHNVLRDESNLEINCIYSLLWPAMVSNSNSYNARFVLEVLSQLTAQSLKYMPNNYSMLKLMGDLNYVASDSASALKYYFEAAAAVSDFFTQPVPKAVLDDLTLKRMIKCCSLLNCYTQAAVLCQCLDDVDYSTAFRCFAETKNLHCADAMDAYYPCIWDITLLEYLVNMHSKRGEAQRKQQVIKLMGLLELNSNNNEEIQREATNIRRSKLFRALTRQYSVLNATS